MNVIAVGAKRMLRVPIEFEAGIDEVLVRARARYRDAQGAIHAVAAGQFERAAHFDVEGMDSVLAISFWGRSGSFLLASYLDGHEHTVVLPMLTSQKIHQFFHEYESLSVWEKLVAYPEYSELRNRSEGQFFDGDFAIDAASYYASVQALFAVHGGRPAAWLNSRARFLQLVHVAYAVALGGPLGSPRPLIVYAQHAANDETAARLAADFPKVRFIHTIRDPISALDSWFDRVLELRTLHNNPSAPGAPLLSPALDAVTDILTCDRAQSGMAASTRAIRFEDLHLKAEATMRRLADWVGIPYLPCLLESTWNGHPWVVVIRGVRFCGANPDNVRRRCKHLDSADRLFLSALLHDNFIAWSYPIPTYLRKRWVRWCVIAALLPLPMKVERITAGWVARLQVLPNLKRGRLSIAVRAPLFLLKRRWRIMSLIGAQARARVAGGRRILELL